MGRLSVPHPYLLRMANGLSFPFARLCQAQNPGPCIRYSSALPLSYTPPASPPILLPLSVSMAPFEGRVASTRLHYLFIEGMNKRRGEGTLVLLRVVTSCCNKPTLIFLDVYSSHVRLCFWLVESSLLGPIVAGPAPIHILLFGVRSCDYVQLQRRLGNVVNHVPRRGFIYLFISIFIFWY